MIYPDLVLEKEKAEPISKIETWLEIKAF